MNLFTYGAFKSNAGIELDWKIDCDALSNTDLRCLALAAIPHIPLYGSVEAVSANLERFADAFRGYAVEGHGVLIVDDVYTTGGSMERKRNGRQAVGLVMFARRQPASWVTAIFQVNVR